MFQQSFLEPDPSSRKPFSLGLSLLVQAVGLALLALLPLLYSPQLPVAQLRSFLLAPPPPTAPVVSRTITPAGRVPTGHRFVFHPDLIDRVARPLSRVADDRPPALGMEIPGASGDANGSANLILGAVDVIALPAPKPIIKPVSKPVERKILRLGGGVSEANLIHKVQPLYPALARSARVSGTVEFSATISKEGLIENLQLVHGHPLLVDAAKQAILQWRYKPTLLNGQPVEVITSIIVSFNLN